MTGAAVWWIAGGFIAVGGGVIWLIVWSDVRYPREPIQPRRSIQPASARRPARTAQPRQQPMITPVRRGHGAFAEPITVRTAQKIMQEHLECSTSYCPRKRQARDVLAAAGKIAVRARPRDRLAGAPTDVIPVVKRTP